MREFGSILASLACGRSFTHRCGHNLIAIGGIAGTSCSTWSNHADRYYSCFGMRRSIEEGKLQPMCTQHHADDP